MSSQARPPDLAGLGLASAALMHDVQALVGALREHAAFTVDELESGRLPLPAARSVLAGCEEIQEMVDDVVATVSGRRPSAPFDPVATIHREISRVSQRASPLAIHCRSSCDGRVWVWGRETLLARSVANLLRNAARHARDRIEVRVRTEGRGGAERLLVAVEDDGSGVPEEVRETLFAPGVHRSEQGSGVGLASVAWAMGHLGGEVRLGEGGALGGACFELRVPLRLPAEAGSRGSPYPGVLAGRTVAVIDDDEMVRRSVVRILERSGARVVTVDPVALRSDDAWDDLAASAPDALLLDLCLGRASGIDAWHRLNARFPALAQRVAFYTGLAGWGEDEEVFQATGRPVLAKGGDIGELVAAVERLIHAGAGGV
ncbi:MAG: hybrid sensor histidine kinase/response regulator [Gemmatimonadetes bacterium]|nr:hybrid sensor histidine kinase/response regulator [Gemmatimonadota bacterium]